MKVRIRKPSRLRRLTYCGIKLEEQPPAGGDQHGDQGKQRDDIKEEQQRPVHSGGEQAQTDGREEPVDHEVTIGDEQDDERPEDDKVVDAERARQDLLLAEGEEDHLPEPLGDVVAALLRFAETDEGEPPPGQKAENRRGQNKEYGEEGVVYHLSPFAALISRRRLVMAGTTWKRSPTMP